MAALQLLLADPEQYRARLDTLARAEEQAKATLAQAAAASAELSKTVQDVADREMALDLAKVELETKTTAAADKMEAAHRAIKAAADRETVTDARQAELDDREKRLAARHNEIVAMADQKAAYFDGRDAELQAAAQRVLDDRNALIADQEKLDEAKQALEARMARIRAAMEE
jgi:hypothetical protein